MWGISLEGALALAYALLLGLIALALEWVAGHAHRRSLRMNTVGFTYHPDKDIWSCPKDKHLFPVFSDHGKGLVIYRAPASACNACPSKAACTDTNDGREIERSDSNDLKSGMQRFHSGMSLTLLSLATLILIVELFRVPAGNSRIVLAATSALFCVLTLRLSGKIVGDTQSVDLSRHSPPRGFIR